jgi:23S rRNA (guanosine2251-2'-O)-methyltransferase
MKPPHGNRPGGSSRPPSDRGPYRGPGASSSRPSGGPGGGSRGGDSGPRDFQKPRPHGAPKMGAPKSGPRDGGPRPGGSEGGFKPRPDQGQRSGGTSYRPREHEAPRASADAPKGTVWLYGHHAISAALANPARRLRRLLLTDEAEAAISKHLPPPWAIAPERVDRARLDLLLGRDVVHQGAALLADPLAPPSLQSVLEKPGVIVVLDQVTDPRNVGAIMRSAAAFGAAAVITQDRNAPEETGGLAKAASGALETLPLLRAVNIARTIIALKAANVWCIGLDAAGKPLSGPAFADRRVALVLGAEGEGLRRLTKETCDEIAGLTIAGAVESLNVSAAASVALYELTRR